MKKEEILAICIEEIRRGKSTIEECVARYPNLGKELRTLLDIAASLKPDEVTPSPEFVQRAKTHIFDVINPAPAKAPMRLRNWYELTPIKIVASILLIVLIFGMVGGTTVYAAQSSLPGDMLYPVKTGVENLQLAITPGEAAKADLHLKFAQRRIDEATQLVKLNRAVSPQISDAVKEQFDDALKELGNSDNTKANNNTLSNLSVATLNQQIELEQAISDAPQNSQLVLHQIFSITRRGNTIAQVAYDNHDFLHYRPSVTDQKLDAGQFSIEGTLQSIQDKTWNVGGTVIENVHLSGETPAVGRRVKLQGLINDNNTFISKIEVSENSTEPIKVKGQFRGTRQDGTSSISGISVKLSNESSAQLKPGDNVQLQGGADNDKFDVTGKINDGNDSTNLSGVIIAVDTAKNTITLKIAGNQITVNTSEAQIEDEGNQALRSSDLNRLTGQDARLDGLYKQGNILFVRYVRVDVKR